MRAGHPQATVFFRYLAAPSSLSAEESEHVLEHLIAPCNSCWTHLRNALPRFYLLTPPLDAEKRRSAPSTSPLRYQATELWDALQEHSHPRRLLLVRHRNRYANPHLARLLLELAREQIHVAASMAHEFAELAVVIADRLSVQLYDDVTRYDLLAEALGSLANSQRVLGRYDLATASFDTAWRVLENGGKSALLRASLSCLQASLFKELDRFDEALRLLLSARQLYREAADQHSEGKVLFRIAEILAIDQPRASLDVLFSALPLIDFDREPRLRLMTTHRLIWSTNDSGEPWRAHALFEEATDLYQRFSSSYTILTRFWLKGRILRNLQELAGAEDLLCRACRGLAELGRALDFAVCSIDYAITLLLRGTPDRARESLEHSHRVLLELGVDPAALDGWIDVARAPEVARLHMAAGYFLRYWHTPIHLRAPLFWMA
jgi:tetratricopeptide (TPR) repeat protein